MLGQFRNVSSFSRGEKLYVTKDNRSKPEGKGCRKCFCGTFGVIFLLAAIVVAGLVGGKIVLKRVLADGLISGIRFSWHH